MGRGWIVLAVVLACAPEAPEEAPAVFPAIPLPPKEPAASVLPAAPAEATAPNALSRPEFLARDSVCRRVVAERVPACKREWDVPCDRELLAAAYHPPDREARTGACYYHDRVGCPNCACDYYVKVHKQGFDGGTGCLGTPEDVLRVLYGECAAQRCEPR